MLKPRFRIADLDSDSIAKVRAMEEALGEIVLAVETLYPAAKLDSAQVQRIQAMEKELGVILIAYRSE